MLLTCKTFLCLLKSMHAKGQYDCQKPEEGGFDGKQEIDSGVICCSLSMRLCEESGNINQHRVNAQEQREKVWLSSNIRVPKVEEGIWRGG